MLRKLLLPLAAVGVLGGCMTTGDYTYRGGSGGDYYYGQPQVEYRYHGSPYGYYPYGGAFYRHGLYGYYGYPYYAHPYYRHPYYGHPYYRPPVVVQPRPDGGGTVDRDRDDRPPPWRDLGPRRRPNADPGTAMRPTPPAPARPMPRVRDDGGSRMEQVMRRGRDDARLRSSTEEQ
jgi:hypothetical protein